MGVNKAYCAIHQKDIHAVDNWDLILQQRSKTKPKKKKEYKWVLALHCT